MHIDIDRMMVLLHRVMITRPGPPPAVVAVTRVLVSAASPLSGRMLLEHTGSVAALMCASTPACHVTTIDPYSATDPAPAPAGRRFPGHHPQCSYLCRSVDCQCQCIEHRCHNWRTPVAPTLLVLVTRRECDTDQNITELLSEV